jgi:hypothetical protein
MSPLRTLLPASRRALPVLALPAMLIAATLAGAQAPVAAEAKPAATSVPEAGPLAPLAWLAGCWRGNVNQREFREQWTPLRGGMMIGVSHTVTAGKTQDFEYLRLESRPDGEYYVVVPSGKAETLFKLSGKSKDQDDEIFSFANRASEFPQTIIYRRGAAGWLYAHVEGTVSGAERKVIYPMRRVDCETGDLIER